MRLRTAFFAAAVFALAGCGKQGQQAPQAQSKGASGVIQDGSTVTIEYSLTVDGQVVDSSQGRGPLSYKQGQQMIIPGLEKALAGMKPGERKSVTVEPKDGYGDVDPNAEQKIPRTMIPQDTVPEAGMMLVMTTQNGQQVPVKIKAVDAENVTVDLNHPLAGKTLNFDVTIVKVE
jgi:FKBP-type peptidyl-prolyl cis-trans isomerase 2